MQENFHAVVLPSPSVLLFDCHIYDDGSFVLVVDLQLVLYVEVDAGGAIDGEDLSHGVLENGLYYPGENRGVDGNCAVSTNFLPVIVPEKG